MKKRFNISQSRCEVVNKDFDAIPATLLVLVREHVSCLEIVYVKNNAQCPQIIYY